MGIIDKRAPLPRRRSPPISFPPNIAVQSTHPALRRLERLLQQHRPAQRQREGVARERAADDEEEGVAGHGFGGGQQREGGVAHPGEA